jgi:hypothetical protein
MKLELIIEGLKALKHEWLPKPAEGQPQKVKVSGTGIALLGVAICLGWIFTVSRDVSETKVMVGKIWEWALTGKIERPETAKASSGPSILSGAEAAEMPRSKSPEADAVASPAVPPGVLGSDSPAGVGDSRVAKEKR